MPYHSPFPSALPTVLIAVGLNELGLICFVKQPPSLEHIDAVQSTYSSRVYIKIGGSGGMLAEYSANPVAIARHSTSLWSGAFSICGNELRLWWLHEDESNPTPYFSFRETLRRIRRDYQIGMLGLLSAKETILTVIKTTNT
ncbi:hypothetical protein M413DRAFT_32817 [Hebeloma cylindrosporum]|uniref:Uncharacterized protein n=1 Tax=Hebeloma cylindrosporum TaxID=76867 RepID=A0A0C2XAM3_HEBCY|nr:hypothetical protein M413DRAFT_32817 [Hebeloma cylindrosporum h7]